MIARVVAIVSGIWLMVSPAVLGYGGRAAANDRIFGPIGAAFALVAIWEVVRPLRWGTLPVGLWVMAAPIVLGYPEIGATFSSLGAGAVLAASAFIRGEVRDVFGGGWKTLLPGEHVPAEGSAGDG